MFWNQDSDPSSSSVLFPEYSLGVLESFIWPSLLEMASDFASFMLTGYLLSENLVVIENQPLILCCIKSGSKYVVGEDVNLCLLWK